MTLSTTRIAAALLVSLSLAACSGGDDDRADGKSGSATTVVATTTTADPAADRATASGLNLQPADVPDDWSQRAVDPSGTTDPAQLATCLGQPEPSVVANAEVASQMFQSRSERAFSRAVMAKSTKLVEEQVAAFRGPKFAECARPLLVQANPDNPEGGDFVSATVADLPLPRPADAAVSQVAKRVSLQYLAPDAHQYVLYVDMVLLAKGRGALTLTVVSTAGPVEPSVEEEMVAVLTQRVAGVRA